MGGNKYRDAKSRRVYFFYCTSENIADGQYHGGNVNIITGAGIHYFAVGRKAIRAGTADGNF